MLIISYMLLAVAAHLSTAYLPPYFSSFKSLDKYQLPELPYEYSALEPYINEDTLRNHHQGHHMIYTQRLNSALVDAREDDPELKKLSLVDLLSNLTRIPSKHRQALVNQGGGYFNHNLYWFVLAPNTEGANRVPTNNLAMEFQKYFGSFGGFKELFTTEASKLFGSGYVWLVRNVTRELDPATGKLVNFDYSSSPLSVVSSKNQETPISYGSYPILVIDVWEHAYYLQHQYKRSAHINDWWMLVDWGGVDALDQWWHQWLLNPNMMTTSQHYEL